jgi:hypothetical protein
MLWGRRSDDILSMAEPLGSAVFVRAGLLRKARLLALGVVREEEAMKKRIPISAAAGIAKTYGYDQVIIIARKVGEDPAPHGEHCTTYGVDKENCRVAAMIGDFLKHKVMGWRRGREWLI